MKDAKQFEAWLAAHPPVPKEQDEELSGFALSSERRRKLREMLPEGQVDLHGLTANEALRRVDGFLKESKAQGLRKVLIIHGKGNHSSDGQGVLKVSIRNFVRKHPLAGESGVPDRILGVTERCG